MNYNIYQILLNGLYKPLPFRLFLIFEPKARLVMSQTVSEIYVLKINISKYFYTIPHDILIEKVSKKIQDKNVIKIIKTIIDETDKPYINNTIDKLNQKYGTSIPHYEKGVGLSIGAMTSQFLAIFFLMI